VSSISEPNYTEDCKKLMANFNHWILPDEKNKWQDVSTEPITLITDPDDKIALLDRFGKLKATSEEWTSVTCTVKLERGHY
jgi:hypothetical protein